MSDDQYRGYDIPAGCMIMPNIWYVPLPCTTTYNPSLTWENLST